MRQVVAMLQQELARQRRLRQAAYALHSSLELDELLGLILKVASEGVEADRGTVFLLDKEKREIWSRVLSGDETLEIRLPVGKGIAGTVAETGETVRLADAYDDPRFDRSWDRKSGFRTKEMLCAPIRSREGEIVGVFQLLNKKKGGEFKKQDESYLADLSVHAALAVENARLHKEALEKERQAREISLAQSVQRQLQPESRTAARGAVAVAGINELCEDATGDYYDLIAELPGDRLGVAIGDVSGHGLQAALVMAEARAYLRAFVRTTTSLTHAMDMINDFLVPDMVGGKFISLFAAVIDTASGETEWCNAGHNPPLLYRARTKTIDELSATGRILGVLPDAAYRAGETISLEKGDVVLLYTDGVTEARNRYGELFEAARLKHELTRAAEGEPDDIVKSVRDAVREWAGDGANEDDLTMLAVKRMR